MIEKLWKRKNYQPCPHYDPNFVAERKRAKFENASKCLLLSTLANNTQCKNTVTTHSLKGASSSKTKL